MRLLRSRAATALTALTTALLIGLPITATVASAAPVGVPQPGVRGAVVAFGNDAWGQATVPAGLVGVSAVAAGYQHSLALTSDGVVHAWGGNPTDRQAAVPAGLPPVIAIAAGGYHSVALTAAGDVVAWGRSQSGQTTVPSDLGDVVAIAAGGAHTLALQADGAVVAWGSNTDGETVVPPALGTVRSIAAGGRTSYALDDAGRVNAWGDPTSGGTVPPEVAGATAVSAGAFHALALRFDGTVMAWGRDTRGQLAVPAGLDHVVSVAAGFQHSLAVRDDGTLVAWGSNTAAPAPGAGGQATVPAGTGGVVAAAGGNHTLTLVEEPAFTADAPPRDFQVRQPYSYTFTATGHPTPTFAVTSGALPEGLTLTSQGVLSGVPTSPASASFVVSVSGAGGTVAGRVHTLSVPRGTGGGPVGPGPIDPGPVDPDPQTPDPQTPDPQTPDPQTPDPQTPTAGPTTSSGISVTAGVGSSAAGAPVSVTGSGLLPGSSWTVTMYSTPVVLGRGTVPASGGFTATLALPADVAQGSHRLVLDGTDPNGRPVSAQSYFRVDGGLLTGSSTSGPVAPPSTGPSAATLASTGVGHLVGVTTTGALLLLAGAVAVGTSRRRRA